MPSNCGAGEDSWKSLGKRGDQTSQSEERSTLNIQWKNWCWSWSSSILVIWCDEMTHWKSPWCWDRLRAEEEGVRGWKGWMASLMQWTWTWANSGGWWGKGKPGVLQSLGRKESDMTERLHFHFSLSCIGEGDGNSLQCSCLENPRDRGAKTKRKAMRKYLRR